MQKKGVKPLFEEEYLSQYKDVSYLLSKSMTLIIKDVLVFSSKCIFCKTKTYHLSYPSVPPWWQRSIVLLNQAFFRANSALDSSQNPKRTLSLDFVYRINFYYSQNTSQNCILANKKSLWLQEEEQKTSQWHNRRLKPSFFLSFFSSSVLIPFVTIKIQFFPYIHPWSLDWLAS